MTVKIVKCSQPGWWYQHKIGEEYEVFWSDEHRMYSTVEPLDNTKALGFITKNDCEIIK